MIDARQEAEKYVECACGDKYSVSSYGAGYIDACGKCPNCKAGDIEQPSQEPYAYVEKSNSFRRTGSCVAYYAAIVNTDSMMPLYTHPSTVRRISKGRLLEMAEKHYKADAGCLGGDDFDFLNYAIEVMDACGIPKEEG